MRGGLKLAMSGLAGRHAPALTGNRPKGAALISGLRPPRAGCWPASPLQYQLSSAVLVPPLTAGRGPSVSPPSPGLSFARLSEGDPHPGDIAPATHTHLATASSTSRRDRTAPLRQRS